MKPLLPVFCRPLGYFVIGLGLFIPFVLGIFGKVTDDNLLFYRECAKLLMMMGCVMILFAWTKGENEKTLQIRNEATRNAIFFMILFVFFTMLYHVSQGDMKSVSSSTFLIFLIINVLCLEFALKKSKIEDMMRQNRP